MSTIETPVRLGSSQLGAVRHVCAFFASDEEAYRVLLPFILDGFQCGDNAVHVVRPDREVDHLQRLADAGVDVKRARASGQLDVRRNTETYLHNGTFDQDRMLATFEGLADTHARAAMRGRIVCNMDWLTGSPAAQLDVIEFESRVNDVWARHSDIVICAYDLKSLRGDLAIDIMRTHPMVLIGDVLQENPFFIPPDQFVRKRRDDAERVT